MPTYEYQCPEGHVFEKLQKMSDKPQAKCQVCGKPATRKISGGAGLVFKGSGFYITDYGKDGKGPRKPEPEGQTAESKAGSDSKAEGTKPETKPAPSKSDAPSKSPPRHGKGKAASE